MENWKLIESKKLPPIYFISNKGRVKNQKDKILYTFPSSSGYRMISLTTKHKKFYIHRLVAEYFIGKIADKKQVNHKDGNKTNNDLSNLEIVTNSENKIHTYDVLGRKPWNIKLNKEKAEEIRKIYKQGEISQHKLAPLYGVSVMVINRIINNVQKEYK